MSAINNSAIAATSARSALQSAHNNVRNDLSVNFGSVTNISVVRDLENMVAVSRTVNECVRNAMRNDMGNISNLSLSFQDADVEASFMMGRG